MEPSEKAGRSGEQAPKGGQYNAYTNESTVGADASVEMPKLHNIKLLIASFYTHIDYNYHVNIFKCRIQNRRETQGVGNDRR